MIGGSAMTATLQRDVAYTKTEQMDATEDHGEAVGSKQQLAASAAGTTQLAIGEQDREEAERLHRRAVAAEAVAAARMVARQRGVALKKEEEDALKAERAQKPKFMSAAQRRAEALARLEHERAEKRAAAQHREKTKVRGVRGGRFNEPAPVRDATGAQYEGTRVFSEADVNREVAKRKAREPASRSSSKAATSDDTASATEQELELIRNSYLGGAAAKKKRVIKPSEKFARIFQFDWDATDDTSVDLNPLYAKRHTVQPLLGRGYMAGLDMREQRRAHNFAQLLAEKRQAEEREREEAEGLARAERKAREAKRQEERDRIKAELNAEAEKIAKKSLGSELSHWSEKKLEDMTDRDWRIFKEDFDIRVRGGRAPHPLRKWQEAALCNELKRAISDLGFKEPSPIQRQAIPVGLEQRDIIGVAETGSGEEITK